MKNNFIHVNIFIVHVHNVFTVPKILQTNFTKKFNTTPGRSWHISPTFVFEIPLEQMKCQMVCVNIDIVHMVTRML